MKHSYSTVAGLFVASLLLAAAPGRAEGKPEVKERVNINSADSSQFAMLPRVGPSAADRIVEYRKENGPFKKPEDLMLVQGIGEKTFQLIKPYLATSGETTLKEKVAGGRSGSRKSGKGKSSGKTAKKEKSPHPSSGQAVQQKSAHPASSRAAKARSAHPRASKAAKGKSAHRRSGKGSR